MQSYRNYYFFRYYVYYIFRFGISKIAHLCTYLIKSFFPTGFKIQRKTLFEFWRSVSSENRLIKVFEFVTSKFNNDISLNDDQQTQLNFFLKKKCEKIRYKWVSKRRHLQFFLNIYDEWLNQDIIFDMIPERLSANVGGRSSKSFEESSIQTKKRKVRHLVESYDQERLSLAAALSVRASGKRDAANLFQEVSAASPRRATNLKKAQRKLISDSTNKHRPYTPEEALAFCIQKIGANIQMGV
jgi:hypothetical protein